MTTTEKSEQHSFQAEIKELLHLLAHSLYQNREIAIRELVSNASDALDKLRHLALVRDNVEADGLEINIEPNKDDRLLVIRDNGLGMTHDDLINTLGTIARSGSLEFINQLSGDAATDVSLIGQFGVGFYSAFMLAETVEVVTRSYADESGWRWSSDGTGSFTIQAVDEPLERGTQVRLHLKQDLDEFTDGTRLKFILMKYSTFVPHPIRLDGEHINDQPPIWVEPKGSLNDEQYTSFYQYLTHHADDEPLWYLHLSADSPFQFHAILYCPPTNFEMIGLPRLEHGIHLCAKRILVQNDNRELLPEYLRFLYGIVDSDDLPLNVSREALQDNTVFRRMRKVLVKRVLDHIAKLAGKREEYSTFYGQFGRILREGVSGDFENRDRIAKLLRFPSSHAAGSDDLVSLDEYIERKPEDQKQIYFVGGMDRRSIEKNPALEVFRKRNLEVLYLPDPADEFVLVQLHTYEDLEIKSIDAVDVSLPGVDATDAQDSGDAESKPSAATAGFARVLGMFRDALGESVEDVRESERLTDSPVCLVNPQGGMSTQMQKILQLNTPEFQMSKLILEVNPQAALVKRLSELVATTIITASFANAGGSCIRTRWCWPESPRTATKWHHACRTL